MVMQGALTHSSLTQHLSTHSPLPLVGKEETSLIMPTPHAACRHTENTQGNTSGAALPALRRSVVAGVGGRDPAEPR
ncbi:hypothetical protein E2C01_024446 [Portunus trituberculatus]|uniref:Uncharacterized protein n=1 Tax=Portunus trituberculatus TaxID=210409 RepID=A0A5B7ECQ6_PORTR|nr:hypothetical protein [Portunus trituberculatus]